MENKNRKRAEEIVSKLTLKEKIGQISQIVAGYDCYTINNGEVQFSQQFIDTVNEYGAIGAISGLLRADPWTGRNYQNGITAQLRGKVANALQRYMEEHTNSKIPTLIEIEASHGLQALDSVTYPTGLACSASFNCDLYESLMQQVGKEMELSGNHVAFLTLIDLARDPRWGRSEECLGEDPFLGSQMAAAAVRGIKKNNVLACAKHFLGAGACESGVNSAELHLGEREVNDIALATAKSCVDAGCDMIMVAYNSIDGTLVHIDKNLLTNVLRDKLRFEGIVISDGNGARSVSGNLEISQQDAAILCIKAGVDLSLQDEGCFVRLEDAVQTGLLDVSYIDRACVRVVEKKLEMGLFENRYVVENAFCTFKADGHCEQIAKQMADESVTLLKNDGILPLSKQTKVVVVGENANDIYHVLGDYTSYKLPHEGSTLANAVANTFDNATFVKGWDFNNGIENVDAVIEACSQADVIVFSAGGTSKRDFDTKFLDNGALASSCNFMDCGEGADLADLQLPQCQIELLKTLKTLGKPIVTIVAMGRAYLLKPFAEVSNALLVSWYCGQEGGWSVADILVGNVNPSGKLPMTLPTSAGVLPVCHDLYEKPHRYRDCEQPVFLPFGYGLSYSKFDYSNLTCVATDNGLKVSFTVKNISQVAGKEVVQLYVTPSGDACRMRVNQLKAFSKILLQPNQKQQIVFELQYAQLGFIKPIAPNVTITIGPSGYEKFPPQKIYLDVNKVKV